MELPDGHVDRLVRRLSRAGLLDDSRGGGPAADAVRGNPEALDRLRPDWASLGLTTDGPGDPLRVLAARRSTRVQVRGAGRVGAAVAALLSGAGVGEVEVRDVGRVEPWDVAPGGLPAEAVGERREDAARRLVRRCAPDRPPRRAARSPLAEDATGHSLVVLAPRDDVAVHAPDPVSAEPFLASGTPLISMPGWWRARAWSVRWSCRARRRARAVSRRTGSTGTRCGHGWWPSGAQAAAQSGRLRPRAGRDRGGAGRRTRAGLPRRTRSVQRGRPLGGDPAAAPLAAAPCRAASPLPVRRRGRRPTDGGDGGPDKGKGEHTSADGGRTRQWPGTGRRRGHAVRRTRSGRASKDLEGACLIFPARRSPAPPSWPRSRSASPGGPPGDSASGSWASPRSWSAGSFSSAPPTSCSRCWASSRAAP